MSVSSNDFFAQAKSQLSLSRQTGETGVCEEMHLRCSIGKSYYAMYHAALEILVNEPTQYEGQGAHSNLTDYLESGGISEPFPKNDLKALAFMLKQQKIKRVEADYKLDCNITSQTCELSLKAAERFMNRCAVLKQPPQQTSNL